MRKETKRSPGAAAVAASIFLLIPVLYAACIRYNISPVDLWKPQLYSQHENIKTSSRSKDDPEESLEFLLRRLVRGKDRKELDARGVSCVTDDPISDICVVNGQVALDTRTATVHLRSPIDHALRPYARKSDAKAMGAVTPVQLLGPISGTHHAPACNITHGVPAVVFSSGGFTTNLFHDLNDVLLPLFLTSYHFRTRVRFVVTDFKPKWIRKFSPILHHLSGHDPIDPASDGGVHCFPGAVVGLRYHGDLFCNATGIPNGYSTLDFTRFLRAAFSIPAPTTDATASKAGRAAPLLVLLSRRNSRVFLNEDEMVRVAKGVGFRVTVASPQRASNLGRFAKVVHEGDVLLGAHGAGMTNFVFMRAGSVLVQIVPLGLDWPSENYFGGPAKEMGLRYVEYKVKPEESSLSDKYPLDHPVIVDPASIFLQGYEASRAIYVDGQNVRLDLSRLEEMLLQVMQMVR